MRIALTAWGINPCGYINIAYMPKSASGTTSTQCQGTAPGMPCCHSYPDTGDQAVRMGRWFVSMARANCTSIALMHALNRYNIYIYIHTPFSPMHMLFSFYLLLHSWPGLSHFLLLCWLWSQRLAAPFSSSSDRAGTTRRTARPPSASASPGCDNGGFRGFEDRFGNHIDIPSYKIHHPSFWYTMVYLANGWFRGFIDGDTWWYMNLTVNI